MSRELFSRSADLRRFREEGYSVQVRDGFVFLHEVPYLSAPGTIAKATIAAPLTLSGEQTTTPQGHQVRFAGALPVDANGGQLSGFGVQAEKLDLGKGIVATHHLSCKPEGGYKDYYDQLTTYAGILVASARSVDPNATSQVFRAATDEDEDSPFHYTDNATARAGIGALAAQLREERIAIVGVGGTGSYILDLVAKTPVKEIRLFDDDRFVQHNAFRAPGAASLDALRELPLKVNYFAEIYSHMHRHITAHAVPLTAENVELLDGITFAFLSMDPGERKRAIVEALEERGASFIDVGMGLDLVDGSLGGILRLTASTPSMRSHVHDGRVSFAEAEQDLYASNIQVADLNSLNACLAVVKWKKIRGFYRDLEREHHSTYTTDGNLLVNGNIE